MQVCEQNTNLKAEVIQLRSSKKQLSSELGKLKQSLSQGFVKSTFINDAEGIMEQLEGILLETKSKLPKHKVYILTTYCMYRIAENIGRRKRWQIW